jgi:hypothetical protein
LESRWLLRRGASAYGWGELPPEAVALLTTLLGRDPRAMHPFRVGKLAAQAQQHPLGRLRRCQDLLAAAHEALVSSPVPQPLVLEMVVVRMLS